MGPKKTSSTDNSGPLTGHNTVVVMRFRLDSIARSCSKSGKNHMPLTNLIPVMHVHDSDDNGNFHAGIYMEHGCG